jgi:hypothetical protein
MRSPKLIALVSLLLVVAAFVAGAYLYDRDVKQTQVGLAQAQPQLVMRADAARYGSAEAKVTIVEFFDPCLRSLPRVSTHRSNSSLTRASVASAWYYVMRRCTKILTKPP